MGVSDCSLAQGEQFISSMPWWEWTSFLWDDDDICFVPDHYAEFDFYRASTLAKHHTYPWKINMSLYSV